MGGEGVRHPDQLVREHGDLRRPRGEVSVQMSDAFATHKISQIAGLEEAPQNARPAVTQRPNHGLEVASGQDASDSRIGEQDRPAAPPEIQISDRSAYL